MRAADNSASGTRECKLLHIAGAIGVTVGGGAGRLSWLLPVRRRAPETTMSGQVIGHWWRTVAVSMLPLLLLGCSFVGPTSIGAEPLFGVIVGDLSGYEPVGSLGFRLRDTAIAE